MASEYTVITNHQPRDIVHEFELTAKERAKFDYLDWAAMERGENSASFFRYKGETYDLGEFMRAEVVPAESPLIGWDGYCSDSFFSGILVKYTGDFEQVIVGRYYC